MHVVGTAGHVDHGKSSLVRALTGTDPDRWIEEKLRGMTLDLGFAHLRFDDGVEAGIVDVPGHERFVHNMLAGAAGMELLLLVVAANDGVRPQTVEHLAILDFLNVRRAIVVLTKRDLVDDDLLAEAERAAREATPGSGAEGAPALAVSTAGGWVRGRRGGCVSVRWRKGARCCAGARTSVPTSVPRRFSRRSCSSAARMSTRPSTRCCICAVPRRRTRARRSCCARSRPRRCSAAERSTPQPTPMPATPSHPTSRRP